jgi:hypothetical protein
VLLRWKDHLNGREERDQLPEKVDLRDDGVAIDSPSREEIESKLKYLKNNKAGLLKTVASSWWMY